MSEADYVWELFGIRLEKFAEPRIEMWDDRWLIARKTYGHLVLPSHEGGERLLICSQAAIDALVTLFEAAETWFYGHKGL